MAAAGANRMVPARKAATVTPHDSTVQTEFRAVYVGDTSGGDVMKVTMIDDDDPVVFTGLQEGEILPITPSLIWSTGTTAAEILGLYGD